MIINPLRDGPNASVSHKLSAGIGDASIGTRGGTDTKAGGCVNGKKILAKPNNSAQPLRGVEGYGAVCFGNIPCGKLGSWGEPGNEKADNCEGAPSAGEICGVNLGVNGRVRKPSGGLKGEGVVLNVPEMTWLAGLGDDAERGGLEGPNERL